MAHVSTIRPREHRSEPGRARHVDDIPNQAVHRPWLWIVRGFATPTLLELWTVGRRSRQPGLCHVLTSTRIADDFVRRLAEINGGDHVAGARRAVSTAC